MPVRVLYQRGKDAGSVAVLDDITAAAFLASGDAVAAPDGSEPPAKPKALKPEPDDG